MSTAAAWISGALFLFFLIRACPGWVRCFTGKETNELNLSETARFERREYGRVLLILAGSLILRIALVCAVRLLSGRNTRLEDTFYLYSGLDTRHYLDIARDGYTAAENLGENLNLVFLPGYPLLAGMLMMLLPNEALCGYLAAWLPFLGGGLALYRLLRLDGGPEKATRQLAIFCLFPAAVFFAYPMSESLFLMASAGSLYAARTRRWFAAGVFGFWAAFTRSPGVLTAVPLGVELICQQRGQWRKPQTLKNLLKHGACLLMVPAGTAVYLYINFTVTGDPLIFLQYQQSNWHQHLGWFFQTAATQTEYAIRTWTEDPVKFWGLWMPNLITGFISLIWMGRAAKKLRPSYTAWFAVYFAVCYGSSWLLSGPRYMTVFFPLAVAADELRVPKWLLYVLLTAASIGYTLCFAMRWGVW